MISRTLPPSRLNRLQPRFLNTERDKLQLIKKVSTNRKEWEQMLKQSSDDSTPCFEPAPGRTLAHSGFGKHLSAKSRMGCKFIPKLQTVSTATPEDRFFKLLEDISSYIDEYTPFELIDIGYYLTRINRPGCGLVVEPVLHRFFSLPERYSVLNGIYFHRLLRTMFIFQDVTYRVWVYEIAQMVAQKHDHLLMRDVQLIVDDLSLFYDSAAQGTLTQLEDAVVSRVNELDLYRLPLLIHALGRSGYNSVNVAKVVHEVYSRSRGEPGYYSTHLVGLLLKGYASFQFHPGNAFLNDLWTNVSGNLKVGPQHRQGVEFKYMSWLAESFLRLRFFGHVPKCLDELIEKHKLLSHLEFTDFITSCWSIQSHLLSLEFRNYLVPGTIWQDWDLESPSEFKTLSPEHNGRETVEMLHGYYAKLHELILAEMPAKIYESTAAYRATQFELVTRLLDIYPNPRDFRTALPLRKFDLIYPVVALPGDGGGPRRGEIGHIFREMSHLAGSRFFGRNAAHRDCSGDGCVESLRLDAGQEALKTAGGEQAELRPLHPLLKQYIHSFYFRTPALAPRGLRLLIQGLVRIHFERREALEVDPDLVPDVVKRQARPFSKAIMREVFRKIACFNNDDLLVALFGMLALNMFELELAPKLVETTTQMWAHQRAERKLSDDQVEMLALFFDTLRENHPGVYQTLDRAAVESVTEGASRGPPGPGPT